MPGAFWGSIIYTPPGVDQGLLALPEPRGPSQGQEARGSLEAGLPQARDHQVGEVEEVWL